MFEITGNLTGIAGTVTATIVQGDGYYYQSLKRI